MTLIVAICTVEKEGEGVLISSDSQATVGPVSYRVHKIVPIELADEPLALAAGAGDTALVKKALEISEQLLTQYAVKEWDGKTPLFDQFNGAILEIENSLMAMISFYEDRELKVDFDFLLGSVDSEGKASLYIFDRRGMAQPVHDDPGFASIGSGFYLGGNLLLQQFYSPYLDLDRATYLATYTINQVSLVDPGVGPFEGDSFHFHIDEKKKPVIGELTRQGFQMVKREYEWRRKLLKYAWQQSDIFGARDFHKKIKDGIQEATKKLKRKKKKRTTTKG